jgi:hypothetical protein
MLCNDGGHDTSGAPLGGAGSICLLLVSTPLTNDRRTRATARRCGTACGELDSADEHTGLPAGLGAFRPWHVRRARHDDVAAQPQLCAGYVIVGA